MPIAFGGGIFGGGGGGVSGIGAAGRLALWSSASGLTSDAGLTYSGTGTGTVLRIGSAGTGLSEISAGVLGVGTGAAGSAAGTVVADRHAIWGSTDTYIGYSGGQNAGSVILAESATPVLAIGANAGANILGLMLASGYRLSWGTIGGLPNLFLSRRAAATLQLGAADSATPVAQTLAFQGSRGGTDTNTAGADATIQGSLGTGSAASGKIVFKVGTPNASGSTQHTANTVLTLQDTGTGGTAAPKGIFAGPVIAQVQVTANTGTATPAATDSRTVYTNTGDTDGSTVTLPAAAAGLQYTVYVDAAQTVTITAVGDDTIRIAGNVTAAAGSITSNVTGSSVTLTAISATQWVATSSIGTWTF